MRFMPWQFVGGAWTWPTTISGLITWRASMLGWSAMWSLRCVMVRSVAVYSLGWARLSWAASVVAVSIPVLRSRVPSMWNLMAQPAMSSKRWLWLGSPLPLSIFTVVPQTWFGMVAYVWFVVCHWSSWRWYSVWTFQDNVTIFFAFIAPNVRAMSCDISLLLTLETAILFIRHHINYQGWDDCCCELLWSI